VQTVAICGYLEPLSAVVLAAVLLQENMTVTQLFGAIMIIGGSVFGEMTSWKKVSK
jgi:drug/metabolite transporter (DMT)-like permease